MSNFRKGVLAFLFTVLGVGAALLGYGWYQINQNQVLPNDEVVVGIPAGYGSEQIIDLLLDKGILANRFSSLVYLYFSPYRGRLQAGEYVFDGSLNVEGVFQKLADGQVRLYTFTVPEGLRIDQMAVRWEEAGFGSAGDFLEATENALDDVLEINPAAVSAEGYLFPETYSFPRNVSAQEGVRAMLAGFRGAVGRLEAVLDAGEWPLDLNDTLTLASLIESEAAIPD